MHIERLTHIAEWLEGGAKHERVRFDMTTGLLIKSDVAPKTLDEYNQCGTACCIAGAAVQFFNAPFELLMSASERHWRFEAKHELELPYDDVFRKAQELLGLTREQAGALFEPGDCCIQRTDDNENWCPLDEYNDAAWAARTIRHLIATGNVDWEATRAKEAT